ncbi:unnamed protein product [Alopecurus aequalis]
MPTVTGGAGLPSQQPSSSGRSERKRKRRRRRSDKAGEETLTKAAGTRIREDDEETEKKMEEDEEVVSSAPSSPLLEPRLPDDDPDPPPELIEALERAELRYGKKRDRHEGLVTIEFCGPSRMFFNPELLPVAEPATKAVLLGARFVVGLSSSIDDELLGLRKRCSGFWIDWSKENKTGIVLTTGHLISSEECSVEAGEGDEEDAPHGEVTVHFLDGSSTVGQLIYHQKHYDLLFVRVKVDQSVQLPNYNDGVQWGQLAFWLGRDAKFNLTMTHLRPGYMNPNAYERPHYMFFPGKEHIIKYDNGGPIIDLDAKILGMINSHRSGSFIPTSVLLKCVDLWKEFGCIPRPHLGLQLSGIKFINIVQAEKIWRKYKIDDGLIVKEILKGSKAEEVGIRRGDIIECFNGECISNTVQLENLLLSLCKADGNGRNAKIHISLGVFQIRKLRRKIIEFTVGVSESREVIHRGYKYVTLEEGTSAASLST